MKYIGEVLETFSANSHKSSLPRPIVDKLELMKGYGIKNDKFAGKDEDSSVMIIGRHSYEVSSQENIDLQWGSFGENILFDFNPHELPLGTKLHIEGGEIVLKDNCPICDHLIKFDKKLPQIARGNRGVYCKIEESGIIKKGMKVYIKD